MFVTVDCKHLHTASVGVVVALVVAVVVAAVLPRAARQLLAVMTDARR